MQGGLRGEIEIPPDLPANERIFVQKDLLEIQSIAHNCDLQKLAAESKVQV